jgi:hypothetical protein
LLREQGTGRGLLGKGGSILGGVVGPPASGSLELRIVGGEDLCVSNAVDSMRGCGVLIANNESAQGKGEQIISKAPIIFLGL